MAGKAPKRMKKWQDVFFYGNLVLLILGSLITVGGFGKAILEETENVYMVIGLLVLIVGLIISRIVNPLVGDVI